MSKNPYARKYGSNNNQSGGKSYRQLNINFANNIVDNPKDQARYKLNLKNIQKQSQNFAAEEPPVFQETPTVIQNRPYYRDKTQPKERPYGMQVSRSQAEMVQQPIVTQRSTRNNLYQQQKQQYGEEYVNKLPPKKPEIRALSTQRGQKVTLPRDLSIKKTFYSKEQLPQLPVQQNQPIQQLLNIQQVGHNFIKSGQNSIDLSRAKKSRRSIHNATGEKKLQVNNSNRKKVNIKILQNDAQKNAIDSQLRNIIFDESSYINVNSSYVQSRPEFSRGGFMARSQSVLQKPMQNNSVRSSYGANIKQNVYNSAYDNESVLQSENTRNLKANSVADQRNNRNTRGIITSSFPVIKGRSGSDLPQKQERFYIARLKYPQVEKKKSLEKPVLCSGTGEMRYNETVASNMNYPLASGSHVTQSFNRKRRHAHLRAQNNKKQIDSQGSIILSNDNNSIASIQQRKIPMEEMHNIQVKHHQYLKNMELEHEEYYESSSIYGSFSLGYTDQHNNLTVQVEECEL